MFDKEYDFYGKYADYAKKLRKSDENPSAPFKHLWDVYLIAPIIGFQYHRTGNVSDKSSKVSIFPGELISHGTLFNFAYRLIMLSDTDYEPDFNKRIEKAFKTIGTDEAKADEEHYEAYVLGGVEVLHEKLILQGGKDSITQNILTFISDYDNIYNKNLSELSIKEIIKAVSQ